MLRFMPVVYGLVLALEIIALTALYAVATPDPSDPVSVWLGTLGLLSMIVMLVYSFARRLKFMRSAARLSYWLHLHIFLGLQGFVFVFFHSLPMFWGSRFMWLNPGVLNFIAVCVVIGSGIFGRWLFSQVPKTLGGQHMVAKEVEAEIRSMSVDLPGEVTALWKGVPETRSIFGMIKADMDRRTAVRKLRRMDLDAKARELAERRLQLERHKAALSVTQRVFKWWIILHRPIAAIMYILSAVHFLLALMFTPTLRFFWRSLLKRTTAIIALFVSTAAIAGTWKTMLSPGALHTAHQSQEGNCDACHLSFAGIPNDKCLGCHEGLAARITDGKGFHATVKSQECIACHTDHVGENGSQTKPEALEAFNHTTTGFSLLGSHSDVKCETCHDKPVHEMQALCGQCHEDSHSSALGPTCNSCHEPVAWTSGLKALNLHLLSMEGKHGQQECSDCHLHGDNLDGDAPCSNCHEDTHGGTVAPCKQCHEVTGFKPAEFDHGPCTCAFPGKHQTVECLACHEGFQFTNTPIVCSGCHDDERPHDPIGECSACHTATSWVDNRFDHNKQASFKITGAHEAVSCAQCHAENNFRSAPTACEGCHEESGLNAHGDFSSFGGCAACHEVAAFAPSTFDHATTGFVLDGRHGTLGCQGCHDDKVEGYPGR